MSSHYDISKKAHTYSIWTQNLVDSAQTPVATGCSIMLVEAKARGGIKAVVVLLQAKAAPLGIHSRSFYRLAQESVRNARGKIPPLRRLALGCETCSQR